MGLRGFQPFSRRIPKDLTISSTAEDPELGSPAPYVQASRWLPRMTTSSWIKPGIVA